MKRYKKAKICSVWSVIPAFILMAYIPGGPAVQAAEDTIKIGVIGPMKYVQGIHHLAAAEIARDEIMAAGGISVGGKQYKIRLVQADSNEIASVTDAVNAMERIIANEKVDFIVGGFRSEATLAMMEVNADYKTIFLSCGPASPICPFRSPRITTDISTGSEGDRPTRFPPRHRPSCSLKWWPAP